MPKHGTVSTAGTGQNDNDTDHHSRAVQRQDIDHSPQAGSGDSVGTGNQEVEPLSPFTRIEDHRQSDAEIVRLEFGRRYLSDKP